MYEASKRQRFIPFRICHTYVGATPTAHHHLPNRRQISTIILLLVGGVYEVRTRDLYRDRVAF